MTNNLVKMNHEEMRIVDLALQRYQEDWRLTLEGEAWYRSEEHVQEMRRFVAEIGAIRARINRDRQRQAGGNRFLRRTLRNRRLRAAEPRDVLATRTTPSA